MGNILLSSFTRSVNLIYRISIFVQEDGFRWEICSRRFLSKKAFTSEKLAQMFFLVILLEITILIHYRMKKIDNVKIL